MFSGDCPRDISTSSALGRRIRQFVVCLVCALAPVAHADIILDFEGLTSADSFGHSIGRTYSEDGYTLTGAERAVLGYWGTLHPYFAGSTAMALATPRGQVTLTSDSGKPFDLVSMDLSELSTATQPVEVQFTGVRDNASLVVSDVIMLDGQFGFETYSFTGFTDLVSVSWAQLPGYHQFDNLVIATDAGRPAPHMPAPGATLLGLIGMATVNSVKRRLG